MSALRKPLFKSFLPRVGLGAPLLLLSLTLHGLVLSLPVPGWDAAQENAPEELGNTPKPPEDVKVVVLPTAAPPQSAAPKAILTPTPKAAQSSPPLTRAQSAVPTPTPAAKVQPKPTDQPPEEPSEPPADPPAKVEPLPAEPPPPTLADRLRDPNAYAYNNQTKSAEVGIQDFTIWYSRLVSDPAYGDVLPGKPPETFSIQYPLNTCLPREPELGRLGVVVDAAGTIVSPPEILASTGYDVLDEQAVVSVSKYPFSATGTRVAYGLSVQIEYNAATCVSAVP